MMGSGVSERAREGALYVVAISVALAIRIPSLSEGFWIDEVMSGATIRDPWTLMFTRVGFTDVHPPGYYALLKCWALIVGDGDAALRCLSLLAGLATVGLVIRWTRAHVGRWGALFAGLALACAPFHIHYSVEVRAYALFTLIALLLAWSVERWAASPTRRAIRWVVLLEVLALGTHYYALLWVVLLNLFVFTHAHVQRRSIRLQWLKAQLTALAVFAAWLPMLFVQMFELPEVMKSHLSDDLPIERVIAALGPLPSWEPGLLAIGLGGALGVMAALGAWSLVRRTDRTGIELPDIDETTSIGSVLLLAVALLFMPLVPLVVMPMSEALVGAYMRQLAWTYAAITGIGLLGAVAALAVRVRLSVALAPWLLVGGPLLIAGLTQIQPMLFLRNLLVFVPLVYILAAVALSRVLPVVQVGASVLVVALAASHAGAGSAAFMPRQDFHAAAEALEQVSADVVVVAPRWDAQGLERYGSVAQITPIMDASEIGAAVRAASSVVVILSRPDRLPMTSADVQNALTDAWRLEESRQFRGHRGPMQWLRYTRADGG